MMRVLLKILLVIVALGALVVVVGPFLISVRPADGLATNAEAALAQSRFIEIPFSGADGLEVHYLRAGTDGSEAVPFVLLHGFTFKAWTWDGVLDAFAVRGPTVAYDQVPYGLSAKPRRSDVRGPSPFSKDAAVLQLGAVLDAMRLDPVILVGNSSGGTLALEAALADPARVQALILVAPWVFATRPTVPTSVASLPQMRRLSLLIARKLGETGPLLDLSYAEPARITEERRRRFLIHTRVAGWDLAWGELLGESLAAPVTVSQHLAEIRVPVLVVTGERDRVVPVEDTRRVAEQLPDATLAVLPDCGHVPQEECPAAFMKVVSDWLDGRDLAPTPR
jgi:pimeloyl-ACP methyl ester carboxylesterase